MRPVIYYSKQNVNAVAVSSRTLLVIMERSLTLKPPYILITGAIYDPTLTQLY